ncbi:AraC family transcriptional regulator [Paraburkholderia unamae]|uniref:AraC family transcriptional regulator n=1 Tax=Paraburkholderia unamae TaxID=219649 RepID=A0ABX5KS21_9BURK|nr:AraC family transcriptional regulator [Paraburkholderia unamae]PVX84380.1 AraC family transcriptional regulator [Paraburkholderia unamae]CAG9247827.1 Transcriptional regulator, AraC/XylS family [Paraburkholderia unamae]
MTDGVEYKRLAGLPGLVLGVGRFKEFSFERHYHLDYHVGLVTDGVQRQCVNGEAVLLGPGRVSLMPPGEIHDGAGESGNAYTLKTFRLSGDLLRDVAAEVTDSDHREPGLNGMMLEDRTLAAQLLQLHDAMRLSPDASALCVQSEWLSLLHCLFARSGAIKPVAIKGALSPVHWQRLKDYCLFHLAEKITLDELATLCGLGRFHFLRRFKQTIGMTPHAWLLRLRLERACSLLARGKPTIAEVAQGVGFYDQSHFNRAFRQAFGVAPSAY